MARSKKAKVLTSVAAVALAASMLIGGGTYAYLQGETNDVVNSFDTNEVTVDLTETTGSNYEIIPGTTQAKDPKVTVNATVDAYVYVTVDDATDGLVTYTMADGWTQLEGYDNVYYREVTASDAAQEFDVLAGNQVSYDAALTNTDMVDAEGNLKEGVDLTFKAYAIQKDPFGDPVSAFEAKESTFVKTQDELIAAIEKGGYVTLEEDIELTKPISMRDVSSNINLNNCSILLNGGGQIDLYGSSTLTVEGNGIIDTAMENPGQDLGMIFRLGGDSVINIKGGEFIGGITVVQVDGNAVCNVYGGTFKVLMPWGDSYWTLNKIDGTKATTDFNVYGGSFLNFDPANATCENPAENWVAEGYSVKSATDGEGTWYTVVPSTK